MHMLQQRLPAGRRWPVLVEFRSQWTRWSSAAHVDRGRLPERDHHPPTQLAEAAIWIAEGHGEKPSPVILQEGLQLPCGSPAKRDAFYHFKAANQNLVPEALQFIERLAGCISPVIGRTKAQVYGERLDFAAKLVFVPAPDREKDEPLDLHREVFVSHRGVFLDVGQFSVYVAKFFAPKKQPLPLVHAWHEQEFVPDGEDAKTIAKDLVEFSRIQWLEFACKQARHESETLGADREVSLPHASTSVYTHDHPHEQFEPNLGKGGRQEGDKGKEKGKGKQEKGKQGKSPPGGVTYYDYVGQSDRSQGYTWYWNQQRGWYWRWD
eukprot:s253_g24.t1